MRALIISDSETKKGLDVVTETEHSLRHWGYDFRRFPQTAGRDITAETWRDLGIVIGMNL